MATFFPKYSPFGKEVLFRLICTVILIIPALINGYPLVNADTGTYLASGFLFFTPPDRPIAYGLFVRAASWNGATLWPVIGVQAYIVCWLIFRILRHTIRNPSKFYSYAVITIACLSLFTSLSWVLSELIADIFTPIAFLAVVCILLGDTRINTIIQYMLLLLALCAHASHPMIFFMFCVVLLVVHRLLFSRESRRRAIIHIFAIAGLCIVAALTLLPVTSRSSNAFFLASLTEKGILKPYLRAECGNRNYKLCRYLDRMQENSVWFLWEKDGPLIDGGGWDSTKEEFGTIAKDILLHRRYNVQFAKKSAEYTVEQLGKFNIGDGNYKFDTTNNIYGCIHWYISAKEAHAYAHSIQNRVELHKNLDIPNTIIYVAVIISLIFTAVLIVYKRRLTYPLRFLLAGSIALIVINAWNCATFSTVIGRYNCRVMWLVPLCFLLILYGNNQKEINTDN